MKRAGEAYKLMSQANKPYIGITLDLGVLGTVRAMMFINEKKKEPLDPDYNIMIADDQPKASPKPAVTNHGPVKTPYKKPVVIPKNHAPEAIPVDEPPADLWDRGY